jgi:hypothetical protein
MYGSFSAIEDLRLMESWWSCKLEVGSCELSAQSYELNSLKLILN